MSAHYSLLLALPLVPALAADNFQVLDFVLNDHGAQPDALPSHACFKRFAPQFRFHQAYRDVVRGAWASIFWRRQADDGSVCQAGVNLVLPGLKLEAVWQDLFPFAQWLASMSCAQGSVGIVVAEDLNNVEPMVLYVRNARLFVGSSKLEDVCAVDDGAPYLSED
jgi:hypothetical protein